MSEEDKSTAANEAARSNLGAERAWGIEVGGTALRAVETAVEVGRGRLALLDFQVIPYTEALPGRGDSSELPVARALEVLTARRELSGTKVAISISGRGGLIVPLAVPPVERHQLDAVVAMEARQRLPISVEELAWDYQPLVPTTDAGGPVAIETIVAAVRREQLEQVVKPFQRAGIELALVQMLPNALASLLAAVASAAEAPSPIVLDMGAAASTAVATRGAMVWYRTIPIGGRDFTTALAEKAKLAIEKAELVKCNPTRLKQPEAVFSAVRPALNGFADEVERTLHGFRAAGFRGDGTKMILVGNGARLAGLSSFLRLRFGPDVQTLGAFPLVASKLQNDPGFHDQLSSLGVAYGLAAQALGIGPIKTNLLPRELRQRPGGRLGGIRRLLGR